MRHLDDLLAVVLACLQQQHLLGGVCRQPVGQQAARKAATHNDVVIRVCGQLGGGLCTCSCLPLSALRGCTLHRPWGTCTAATLIPTCCQRCRTLTQCTAVRLLARLRHQRTNEADSGAAQQLCRC